MDGEFVDAWKIGAMDPQTRPGDRESNIFHSFAMILSRTPGLRTLRIRVAELTGQRSGWRKFALVKPFGIQIGFSLEEAIQATGSVVTLPALHSLELDGFEDIASLLRLTPNLDRLRVSLSAGFWRGANTEVCGAIILFLQIMFSVVLKIAHRGSQIRTEAAPSDIHSLITRSFQYEW